VLLADSKAKGYFLRGNKPIKLEIKRSPMAIHIE